MSSAVWQQQWNKTKNSKLDGNGLRWITNRHFFLSGFFFFFVFSFYSLSKICRTDIQHSPRVWKSLGYMKMVHLLGKILRYVFNGSLDCSTVNAGQCVTRLVMASFYIARENYLHLNTVHRYMFVIFESFRGHHLSFRTFRALYFCFFCFFFVCFSFNTVHDIVIYIHTNWLVQKKNAIYIYKWILYICTR